MKTNVFKNSGNSTTRSTKPFFKSGSNTSSSKKTKNRQHFFAPLSFQSQPNGVIQRLSDPDCDNVKPLRLTGACRKGFIHTCYSETFTPNSSSALHVHVEVGYETPPPPYIEGKEDFSVQVYKCGSWWDTLIGSKRISTTLPDILDFNIASVNPNDKYYIKIYSRSIRRLIGDYVISQ